VCRFNFLNLVRRTLLLPLRPVGQCLRFLWSKCCENLHKRSLGAFNCVEADILVVFVVNVKYMCLWKLHSFDDHWLNWPLRLFTFCTHLSAYIISWLIYCSERIPVPNHMHFWLTLATCSIILVCLVITKQTLKYRRMMEVSKILTNRYYSSANLYPEM